MLSEYRQRLGEFQTAVNRDAYLAGSGRREKRAFGRVLGEYSDLFRLSVVAELRTGLAETSEVFQTEKAGIRRLIAFALEGNLAARLHEVSLEIESHQAIALIEWEGRKITAAEAAELLSVEPELKRRRELEARRAEAIRGADDLRAARFDRLHIAAVDLGYRNYLDMLVTERGIDAEKMVSSANRFLASTENRFVVALSPLLTRQAQISLDEANQTDLDYLRAFSGYDHYFSPERMLEVYRELFSGLGFKTEVQTNLTIEPGSGSRKVGGAACYPVVIPEEIRLVVNLTGGQANYRRLCRVAGTAQNFAWTSRHLHPEFRFPIAWSDSAARISWGLLLESLFLDRSWLLGTLGLRESEEFRRTLAILRLTQVRRLAARLNYEVEYHSGALVGRAGERYVKLLNEALHVTVEQTEYLSGLSDSLSAGDYFRAYAFESQLREYLMTKFGSRWWVSRKAGEMLIDLWNTGQRYTVEEMADLIGLGGLDYDWLARGLVSHPLVES